MVARERLLTADDLWELSHDPANEGRRWELSEGELIEMAPSTGEHGGLTFRAALVVGAPIDQMKIGYVTGAETGYILHRDPEKGDTMRAPDLGFILYERLPEGLEKKYIPVAPDFALEVISTHDRAGAIEKKVQEYLRYGTRLIWLVYPDLHTVVVHTPNATKRYGIGDTLDGAEVIPNLSVRVRDLFAV